MSETTVVHDFAASQERVFAALADQDRMGTWMGAKISVPVRGAQGLVGTVRRVHLGMLELDEQIVACEAPRFIAYQIVSPVPRLRYHRGELHLASSGAGSTQLRWQIRMDFTPEFLGPLMLGPIKLSVQRGLERLARSL